MPECNHHVENPKHKNCADIKKVAPTCRNTCDNKET